MVERLRVVQARHVVVEAHPGGVLLRLLPEDRNAGGAQVVGERGGGGLGGRGRRVQAGGGFRACGVVARSSAHLLQNHNTIRIGKEQGVSRWRS